MQQVKVLFEPERCSLSFIIGAAETHALFSEHEKRRVQLRSAGEHLGTGAGGVDPRFLQDDNIREMSKNADIANDRMSLASTVVNSLAKKSGIDSKDIIKEKNKGEAGGAGEEEEEDLDSPDEDETANEEEKITSTSPLAFLCFSTCRL